MKSVEWHLVEWRGTKLGLNGQGGAVQGAYQELRDLILWAVDVFRPQIPSF